MGHRTLLALRIERRSITLAVFCGLRLEHIQVRQLASKRDSALRNAEEFLRWALVAFDVSSVAIDGADAGRTGTWRTALQELVVEVLRTEAIALWEEPLPNLLSGFGYPTCKSRQALRRVTLAMLPEWVSSADAPSKIDAVALGYHVQTVRQFMT